MPNTVSENLQRLQQAKSDIASAIIAKGGTVSSGNGLEEFPNDIASIPVIPETFAFLYVTSENGATITVSKGATVIESQTYSGDELLFKIPESGTWTVTETFDNKTQTSTISITESIAYYLTIELDKIYGVEWDGTSSMVLTRINDSASLLEPNPYYSGMSGTPSSPFDNIMPWSGMVVETKDGNSLVKIPKFWYKITREYSGGHYVYRWQISSKAQDEFKVSPAHKIGDVEYDYVYVGRYKCSSTDYKSQSGKTPKASITRDVARTAIHNLSSTEGLVYWQQDFKMFWTIRMLYLVEFANWNSQACIGYGCGNGSSIQSTGVSDSMSYHTGTMQTSRTTYGVGCQYRNIEDLWGNVYEWVDGIYFIYQYFYIIDNPSNFSDSTGGTQNGTRSESSGVITGFTANPSNYDYALFPSSTTPESTQYPYALYVSDIYSYNSSGKVLSVGGCYLDRSYSYGLFYMNGTSTGSTSSASARIGTRLMAYPS